MVSKVVKRSLKKEIKIFLSINLMIFITFFLANISIFSYTIGLDNIQLYNEQVNIEDFEFQTLIDLTDDEVAYLEEQYETNIEANKKIVLNENEKVYNIYEYNSKHDINKLILKDGSEKLGNDEVLISEHFAKLNNLKVGDEVLINDIPLTIVGLTYYPEDIYPVEDGELISNSLKVANVFVDEETFNKFSNVNSSIIYRATFNNDVDQEKEYDKIRNDLKVTLPVVNILGVPSDNGETLEYNNVISISDMNKNFKIGILQLEYKAIFVIMLAMSLIIGILTVVLFIFLFRSIVQRHKREIGILRAYGISKNDISNKYSKFFLLTTVIVAIISYILSFIAFLGLSQMFEKFFNMPEFNVSILALFLSALFLALVSTLLIISVRYLAINTTLRQDVLKMVQGVKEENKIIENKLDKQKKNNFKFKFNFKSKMRINTLLRNKGKSILLFYGVSFSTILLIFAFSLVNGVINLEDNFYGEDFSYNMEVLYSQGYKTDEQLYNDESIINIFGELKNEENNLPIRLIGYNIDNQYININDDEMLKDNEVYITQGLADEIDKAKGEQLVITNPINQNESYNFVIKDIADNKVEQNIFANINYIQDIMNVDKDYYNGVITKDGTVKGLEQNDKSVYIKYTDEIAKQLNEYSVLLNTAVVFISIFATLISIISIVVITNIIIKNLEKQISIMKVLGYDVKEISNLTVVGYRYIVIITYLIIFPFATYAVNLYLDVIMGLVEDFSYPIVLESNIVIFILGLILITLSYEISLILTKRKINKISLSKALNLDE